MNQIETTEKKSEFQVQHKRQRSSYIIKSEKITKNRASHSIK